VPIFTGFGPDAIAYRMAHSRAKVLCTHWEHASRVPDPRPGGAHLITVTRPGETAPGATSFEPAMAAQSDRGEPARVRREDPAVLLYTSGSTGPPKGVQIAANLLLAIHPSMRYGVDLHADDVFWPTGDPTWSRPTSAAISTRARSSSSTSCPRRRRARSSASCSGSGHD
jgi:acetyl-CoA synthetase